MSATLSPIRYSSTVSLSLVASGQSYCLAQVGPEFVIPAEPFTLPPCDAEIFVTVDGRKHSRTVRLLDGAQASFDRIRIAASIQADASH